MPVYAETTYTNLSVDTNYENGTIPNYPDYTTETVFGTVLLPKIYGKNLDQFEIATDGKIVLSVQGVESMYIDTNTDNTKLSIEASNQSIQLIPNDALNTVQVGDHTWTTSNNFQVMSTSAVEGYSTDERFKFNASVEFNNTVDFRGDTFGIQADEQVSIDTSNLVLNGTLQVYSNSIFEADLQVDGIIHVVGATTLGNTLDVANATTLAETLSVGGATTLSSTLSVTNATTLYNTLSVGGATTLTGATTLADILSVGNATTLTSTLSVGEATTSSSTLSVGKATTLVSTLSVGDATT